MYSRDHPDQYDPSADYGYSRQPYDSYGYANGSYDGGNAGIPVQHSPLREQQAAAAYQMQQHFRQQQLYYAQYQRHSHVLAHAQSLPAALTPPPPPQSDPLLQEFADPSSPTGLFAPPVLHRSQTQAPQPARERRTLHRAQSLPDNWDFESNITNVLTSEYHQKDQQYTAVTGGSDDGLPLQDVIACLPPTISSPLPPATTEAVSFTTQPAQVETSSTHSNLASNLDSDVRDRLKRTEARSVSPLVILPEFPSPSPVSFSSSDKPDVPTLGDDTNATTITTVLAAHIDADSQGASSGVARRPAQPDHTPPRPSDDSEHPPLSPVSIGVGDESPVVPVPATIDSPSPPPVQPSTFARQSPIHAADGAQSSGGGETAANHEEEDKSLPGRTPNLIHVPSSTDTNAEMHLLVEIQSLRARYDQIANQIAQDTAQYHQEFTALEDQYRHETNVASQTEQHNRDLDRRLMDLRQEKENLEAELEEEKEKENLGDPCRPENSLSHVYSEYPPESTVIQNLLQAQIEFYFSDYNLKRDKRFLDQVFDGRHIGFLTVDEVMKLPRVRQLCGEKEQVIKALKRSNILTVDLDRELVGRPRFEKPREKEFPFRRTVFIFGIPRDEDEAFVRRMLEPFGSVSKVQFDHPDSLDTRIGWKFLNKPRVYMLFSPRDHSEMVFRTQTVVAPASRAEGFIGVNDGLASSVGENADGAIVPGSASAARSYWSANVRCGRCGKVKPAEEGFYEAHDFAEILCAQCGAQLADEQINEFYSRIGKTAGEVSESFYLGTPPRDMTKCKTALVVFASQRQASKCAYVRSRIGYEGAFATHFHLYSKIKKEIALSDSSSSPSMLNRSTSVPTRSRGQHGGSIGLHRQNSRTRTNDGRHHHHQRHHGNSNGYHPFAHRRGAGSASVGGLYSHHRAHEPDETPSRLMGQAGRVVPSGHVSNGSSDVPLAWSSPKHTKEVIGATRATTGPPGMVRQSTAPMRTSSRANRGRYRDFAGVSGNGPTNRYRSNGRQQTNSNQRRDQHGFRRQRSANT